VLEIDVPEAEIVLRMSGRRVHPASGRSYHVMFNPPRQEGRDDVTGEPLVQRDDDREDTVRRRLEVYRAQTRPLVEYYTRWAATGDARAPRALRHVGIYAYRVGFLKRCAALAPSPLEATEQLEQLRVLWHGFRIAAVLEEGAIPPGVDTPGDLEAVLKLLR